MTRSSQKGKRINDGTPSNQRSSAATLPNWSSRRQRGKQRKDDSVCSLKIATQKATHAYKHAELYKVGVPGEVRRMINICSAIQSPSRRAMFEAMRRARHFLPNRALPPYLHGVLYKGKETFKGLFSLMMYTPRAIGPDQILLREVCNVFLLDGSAWPT